MLFGPRTSEYSTLALMPFPTYIKTALARTPRKCSNVQHFHPQFPFNSSCLANIRECLSTSSTTPLIPNFSASSFISFPSSITLSAQPQPSRCRIILTEFERNKTLLPRRPRQ